MSKTNSPDSKLGNPKSKRLYSNAIRSQQARILKHFEECPRLSTLQARMEFYIPEAASWSCAKWATKLIPTGQTRLMPTANHIE